MTEIDLSSDQPVVSVGHGISLHPRGLTGKVRIELAVAAGTRSLGSGALVPTLAAEGLRPGPVVSLPPPAAAAPVRALAGGPLAEAPSPTVEVEVQPDESCVL